MRAATDSDLFARSTGDEFKAAVALWCKSWLQVPAASLPDDDLVLAFLSGAGPKWKKVRAMALHGWVKATDGRFYHPVVAEKANEALKHRMAQRARANKRWAKDSGDAGQGDADMPNEVPSHTSGNANAHNSAMPDDMPRHSHGNAAAYPAAMQGTVKGKKERTPIASLCPQGGVDLPAWLPLEPWNDFVEMRRRSRKPLTDRAIALLINRLDDFRQRGIDIAEALNTSTISGWAGVFEPKKQAVKRDPTAELFAEMGYLDDPKPDFETLPVSGFLQ